MKPRDGTGPSPDPRQRIAALEAENESLRAALASAGLDASEARFATTAAEDATRLALTDATIATAGHARDLAAGRADLADATALNTRLQTLNAQLLASEERLDAVVESATDHAIIEMDFDGRITGWSPGAELVLGWTAAEAIGQEGAIIWTPEDRAAGVPERERRLADVAGTAVDDRWHMRRDGTLIWGSGHLTPLRNGRPRGYLKVLRDRTAERRAEEAVRASEAKYRALFDSMDEGCCIVEVLFDPSGRPQDYRFVEVNAAFERHTGLRNAAGRRIRELVPHHDAHWFETYGRVARTGEPERFVDHAEAMGRWFDVYAFRMRSPEEGRVAILFNDITGRQRANDALRESEAHFRALATAGTYMVYRMSPDWRVMRQLDGRSVLADTPEPIEDWADRYIPSEDWPTVSAAIAAAIRNRSMFALEHRVRRADGSVGWVLSRAIPVLGSDGELLEWFGAGTDVTERREAEERLRESEEQFRGLVEGVPQLLWRSADAGQWRWASPQWCGYTGQAPSAAAGLGWLAAVYPEDRQATMQAWAEAPAHGLLETDHRLRRAADGAWRWHQTRAVRLSGPGEEWLGTCTDIEDQMQARAVLARGQEELQHLVTERTGELERAMIALQREMADRSAAEDALRQSQKMEALGQLTGGIAHDFNNMLQGVTGALAMARRRIEASSTSDATRYLDAANDAALRAAGLTRRLLAFARRQRLDPRAVNPDGSLAGLLEMIRRSVGPQVAVDLRLRHGQGVVRCDPNELESAIINLCVNARDAMPRGGHLVLATQDVTLAASDVAGQEGALPGDYVEIRVEDTGAGMPPEVLARVTEPFFTTKPAGQGTGLGLSQVYGFVHQSGGVLRVESKVGRGTTVCLLLPRRLGTAEPERAPLVAPPTDDTATGRTVLLVDDEGGVRGPAAERLREMGCTVLEAATGPEALRLLDEGARLDLLVTDVGLPGGMNGRQVAEAVRERCPDLPVLFISGWTGDALPPGVEVIGKPFDLDTLARRTSAFLGGRQDG